MAERKKDDKNTVEERVGKVLSEALAEELGEIPNVSISVEELRQLEKANRKKKPKKFVKFVSVAAVAVIVCAAGIYLAWPESVVPVDADKNTEQHVKEGNGEVVINEGDVQGDSGVVEINEENENRIKSYRKEAPKLGVPKYVPSGYTFKNLHLEIFDGNSFLAEYSYVNDKNKLHIAQRQYKGNATRTTFSKGKVEVIKTKLGDVYIIQEKDTPKTAVRYVEEGYLKVIGDIATEELVKCLNEIETP